MIEPEGVPWIEVQFEDGEVLAIRVAAVDQNGLTANGVAAFETLHDQVVRIARIERKIRWLKYVQLWCAILMGNSILAILNVIAGTIARVYGSELVIVFSVIVLAAQAMTFILLLTIGFCWMCASGLLDHIDDEMGAIKRSDAHFHRQSGVLTSVVPVSSIMRYATTG